MAVLPNSPKRTAARMRGFTLIEMMIAVAILGVLASMAAPAFNDYILGRRVANAAFDLNASLAYARGEAIKRNAAIVLTSANGTDWGNGWSIAAGTTTLRTQGQYPGIAITASAGSVTYNGIGRVSGAAGTVSFTVDDNAGNTKVAPRCIKLSLTGLPYSGEGSCS